MWEELLVRNCAPTLAGLKTANLFNCPFADARQLFERVRDENRVLVQKGLRVLPLRYRGGQALIYVYRPARLAQDLGDAAARQLLRERGYWTRSAEQCLRRLIGRLEAGGEFPHEIGLFLGYPPEDVRGFLRKEPCKWTGSWKVYGDVATAKAQFAQYRRCTRAYCAQWASGVSVERLTVPEGT